MDSLEFDLQVFDELEDALDANFVKLPVAEELNLSVDSIKSTIEDKFCRKRKRKKVNQKVQLFYKCQGLSISHPVEVATDFRRNIPVAFAHIYNSCDLTMPTKHISQHYHPNVELSKRDFRYCKSPYP
jgi:hypothetical protein